MTPIDIRRDRWGRPLLPPPGGGPLTPHTRVSTLAKTLDDQTGLGKWKQRQTVLGLAARADLWALAKATGREDKAALNQLCEDAMQAAASSAGANLGTALHSFTEAIDAGLHVDPPSELAADLTAYQRIMKELCLQSVEQELFVVNDELTCAGTLDKLVRLPSGAVVVADTKTGQDADRYPHSAAIQIAVYAHSQRINLDTGQRAPLHPDLDPTIGLMIHLPAGRGRAAILKLDLRQAWSWAQMCVEIREWRKSKPATPVHQVTA